MPITAEIQALITDANRGLKDMELVAIAFAAAIAAVAPGSAPVSSPRVETPVASTGAAAVATNTPDADAMVCKSIAVTGTRFPTKVCARKSEWAERARSGREYADRMSRVGATPNH